MNKTEKWTYAGSKGDNTSHHMPYTKVYLLRFQCSVTKRNDNRVIKSQLGLHKS